METTSYADIARLTALQQENQQLAQRCHQLELQVEELSAKLKWFVTGHAKISMSGQQNPAPNWK